MDREEKEWVMKYDGESSNPFVGIEPEVNYMTVDQQKELLRKCLPDEFDSVREGFCMKVKCRNCLLRKPGNGKMTYGECREYAKSFVKPVSEEEIGNPVTASDWIREAKHLANTNKDWKASLGIRYRLRLVAVCDNWKDKKEAKNERFREWLTIFRRMLNQFNVEDGGREMLTFTEQYTECIHREETDTAPFSEITAELEKIVEFGINSLSIAEEYMVPEKAYGEKETIPNVIRDMKRTRISVVSNQHDDGKHYHESESIDISRFFQSYVERLEAAYLNLTSKPDEVKRNCDRFIDWNDAYDAWQNECVLPHPDAVAWTNEGKCMRMVWLFAEWLWKPVEK